jgi:hypothetical protein
MSRVVGILVIVLIVAVALVLVAAVSGLVVWAASGIGWVMINWLRLPYTRFEATVLSLIALVIVTWSAWRLLGTVITLPLESRHDEDEDEYEDEDEDWENEDEEDYEEEPAPPAQHISSIPKWRQPLRRASDGLPIVDPNDKCPCGSGRKYKNCHGRKR